MEVVGLIAAIPELVKLANTTITLLRDVSNSRKALAKITNGLEIQLQALTEALDRVTPKRDCKLISPDPRLKLAPLIQQMREQLQALSSVISSSQTDSKLGRVRLVVGGLKKKLRDDVQKLETSIAILNLHLLKCTLSLGEETIVASRLARKSQVRSLLNPNEHDFIGAKLDGTLAWLPIHPVVTRWFHESDASRLVTTPLSQLLVIHGTKGCGKSVLSASLADYIRSTGKPCVFFSFYHGTERQRKIKSMLSTILWQMINFEGIPEEILDRTFDTITNPETLTNTPLLQAIEGIAAATTKPFHIIVDGIDESEADWNDSEGPLKIFNDWLRKYTLLRVLLVGRKSALHTALGKLCPDSSIEISEDITRNDISQFIRYKLLGSPNLAVMSEELRTHVHDSLQKKSTGMFLWVELVFKELRHCYSPDTVHECLRDLPRDLDAEYARLFKRLMYRLHGRPGKPSHQTRTIRTLLALIIGALEPLSVNDLRYAHATTCEEGQRLEDHVILEQGIFDFLGDFISFTGQNVHFCHSSLEEFLLRPQEEWIGNLEEVNFFRVDYLECHQLIGNACMYYVTNFDFGYPLADDSYHILMNNPFLSYATKYGLLHLMHLFVLQPTTSPTNIVKLKALITGPNFGGLIEFLTLALTDRAEVAENYMSNFLLIGAWSAVELFELFRVLDHRLAAEDSYRRNKFGHDDLRTQSWVQARSAFQNLSPTSFISHSEKPHGEKSLGLDVRLDPKTNFDKFDCAFSGYLHSSGPTDIPLSLSPLSSVSGQAASQPSVPETSCRAIVRSPKAVDSTFQSNVQVVLPSHAMRQALQIWMDPTDVFRKMKQAFVAKLPLPIHMLYSTGVVQHGDKELYLSLLELAMQRTEGQRTFYRVWVLLVYANTCDVDEDIARHRSEAHDIMSRLEDNPVTRMLKYDNFKALVSYLLILGRTTDVSRSVDDLIERQIGSRSKEGRRRRRQFFFNEVVYKTDGWQALEVEFLEVVARRLYKYGLFTEAQRVFRRLVECAEAHFGPHHPRLLHFQWHLGENMLENTSNLQAEVYFRGLLEDHSTNASARQSHEFALLRYHLALSIFRQEKFNEASKVLQQVLCEIECHEKEDLDGMTSEQQQYLMSTRAMLLVTLGKSASLDPSHSLRKELLRRCLEHLDRTLYENLRDLACIDVITACYDTSKSIYGVNNWITWRSEDYFKYCTAKMRHNCECWATQRANPEPVGIVKVLQNMMSVRDFHS